MIEAKTLNVEKVRDDFPILARRVHGHPLVYLDSAATSQKPAAVIDAMDDYYRRYNANPHRGVYAISEEATAAYESARQRLASFINAASTKEVIFTRNTTEAINLVRYSWGRANVHAGDRILLTEMEHHSNLVPWQLLAQETGATLEGTVTYGGQKVRVALIIAQGASGASTGFVNDDGRYQLGNVPLGEVNIAVNTGAGKGQLISRAMAQSKGQGTGPLPQVIDVPSKYGDPTKSGITTTVSQGANTFNVVIPK